MDGLDVHEAGFAEAFEVEADGVGVQAQPLGEFDTWRQALPITLLDVVKPL